MSKLNIYVEKTKCLRIHKDKTNKEDKVTIDGGPLLMFPFVLLLLMFLQLNKLMAQTVPSFHSTQVS